MVILRRGPTLVIPSARLPAPMETNPPKTVASPAAPNPPAAAVATKFDEDSSAKAAESAKQIAAPIADADMTQHDPLAGRRRVGVAQRG